MTAAERPPRSGRLARSAIAGRALVQAGASRLVHKAQDLARADDERAAARAAHEAQLGRILFAALNQLKGVALKAAQMLASEPQLLPEGLRQQLARACYQATPMNRAQVDRQLRQALGHDWAQRLPDFDAQAFAAASLGQVHRARLADGRAVAIKLQYPGMAATVRSDMRLLRLLLDGPFTGLLDEAGGLPAPQLLATLLDEIEHSLQAELDYAQEAGAMQAFREQLRLPGLVVPAAVPEFSTRQVLVMEALAGQHLQEWLDTRPSQAQRDHYGQLIFDSFLRMVFELRWLHADPHPGNYLFMADGQLGLLDFGCTQRLSEGFTTGLAQAWNAALRPDADEALHQAYRDLQLISPGMTLQRFRKELRPALAPLLDWQLAPFRAPVYDFGQDRCLPRLQAGPQRTALQALHQLPTELAFFDRSYLGLNQLLHRLGARVKTSNRWIGPPTPGPMT